MPYRKKGHRGGLASDQTPLERLGLWELSPSDDNAGWVFSVANEGNNTITARLYVISAGGVLFGGAAPVAAQDGAGKATLVFQTPTGPDAPFTYKVIKTTGGSDVVGDPDSFTDASGNTTLKVSGLTPTKEYTFQVIATGTKGATGTSQPSTKITA